MCSNECVCEKVFVCAAYPTGIASIDTPKALRGVVVLEVGVAVHHLRDVGRLPMLRQPIPAGSHCFTTNDDL